MNTITLKCAAYRDFDLVRLSFFEDRVIIRRGEFTNMFMARESERIMFAENPELIGIFDTTTQAWDLDKLYALLHFWCGESEDV